MSFEQTKILYRMIRLSCQRLSFTVLPFRPRLPQALITATGWRARQFVPLQIYLLYVCGCLYLPIVIYRTDRHDKCMKSSSNFFVTVYAYAPERLFPKYTPNILSRISAPGYGGGLEL